VLKRNRKRHGFTLAEVLVAFALVAILAAVLVPTVRGRMQDSYENALIAEFDNIASAVTAYRQDVGHYPPDIDYLFQMRTSSPTDRCGVALSANAKANWRGPYITRAVLSTALAYVFAQKDTVWDSLFVAGSPVGIYIKVNGPDTVTAHNVDVKIDGVANATTGALQWSTNTAGANTDAIIQYIIPTRSGTC
jgi:prepilin-type N-terminal cleavage/methylation domain-containing protein